jgi:hypothetical protein
VKTSPAVLLALHDARGGEAVPQGDALDDVVADLAELARIESAVSRAVDQLEARGAPFDEALFLPTENV